MFHNRILLLILFSFLMGCNSQSGKKFTNHLIHESSPYLLQHANNPVDWYPWGNEALEKAKAENKMILVSIGYAACHWCHVMEHESFEDSLVSKIMNENFVNIKVDREERPDIDDVYMTACQIASGQGCGWPLNAFALPDGRPVWAGTYFPKKEWITVLETFIKMRDEDPRRLEQYAAQLTGGITAGEQISINLIEHEFEKDTLQKIGKIMLQSVDYKNGGRLGSPKFPMPNNYEFLLSYAHRFNDSLAMEAVTITLDNLANGGIYDHLGGGFSRYATDEQWKIPHFEKMLYDNGQLASLYSKAYQLTKNDLYKKRVEETLEFIAREMTHKSGGFYSSLDADSEGEEGKFYVWKKEEIDAALNDEKVSKIFNDYYEVTAAGNWEEHKNILHRKKSEKDIAQLHGISTDELENIIGQAKTKLYKEREKRVRPGLDDKILTSWNALMLTGYVDAYKAFGYAEYLKTALKNGDFLLREMMQKDNRLNRNFKDGKSVINAFLDDYALTIQAFIALYEVTFDEKWLYKANDLAAYCLGHFYDKETAMFNYTSDIDPPLVARKKELSDNVIPGSNSSIARSLFILGTYLYKNDYLDMAGQMMKNMTTTINQTTHPGFYSNWCILYGNLVKPPYEVAIIGDDSEKLRNDLMRNYLPNAILLGGKNEGTLELLKNKLQEGQTMIYVCQNKVCKLPVTEVAKALPLMQ